MRHNIKTLKILLLQIRDQVRVRQEELDSFVLYSNITKSNIDVLNVFDKPTFDYDVLTGYDALFVGGASEASVLDPATYPFVPDCIKLLKKCIETRFPVFASCFGFQLAVLALGGSIVRDEVNFEMGTIPISITKSALQDPLMHDTPDGFMAVSVHRERAPTLPQDCDLLAFTPSCPHAFKLKNAPFWAFQFHPEVDKATLVERLTIFKAHYTENDEHLNQVLSNAQETPQANLLPTKFIERVLLTSVS